MENATNALLRRQCAELLSARSPLCCPGSGPGPSQHWSAPAAAEPAHAPKSSAHALLHRVEECGARGAAAAATQTYPTLLSTHRPLKSEAVGMTVDAIYLTSNSSDNDADKPLDAALSGHGIGNVSEIGVGSEASTMATFPVGGLPADLLELRAGRLSRLDKPEQAAAATPAWPPASEPGGVSTSTSAAAPLPQLSAAAAAPAWPLAAEPGAAPSSFTDAPPLPAAAAPTAAAAAPVWPPPPDQAASGAPVWLPPADPAAATAPWPPPAGPGTLDAPDEGAAATPAAPKMSQYLRELLGFSLDPPPVPQPEPQPIPPIPQSRNSSYGKRDLLS